MAVGHYIQRYLAPPSFDGDEVKTRHARLLDLALNITLVGMPLTLLGNLVGGHTPALVLAVNVLIIAACLVLRRWVHQGYVNQVARVYVFSMWALTTASAAALGSIRTPTSAAYLILVAMAGLLFERRGIVVTIGLSSAAILLLIAAENAGWLPRADVTVTITQWVTYTAMIAFVGGLTYYALTEIRHALHLADRELVERRALETVLQRQNAALVGLHQIALDILKHRSVDDLLRALAVHAAELLDAPVCEIMTLEGDELVVRACTPNQEFMLGDRTRQDQARLSWQAVLTREPTGMDDYTSWEHHRVVYDRLQLHAVASFPIISGERCLGVLDVSRTTPGYVFDAEQLQTGKLFAQLAGLVLDNAQLYAAAQSELAERTQAEARLRQSNAELQTRNEELDAFAHTVAHDLKGPLGTLVGFADLLADSPDTFTPEEFQRTLSGLTRSAHKAGAIVESLLVLASVRRQDVVAMPLDMARIVDEALLRLDDSIRDAGAVIHQPDRSSWPRALGHAPWVEEIWFNYLSNALKYGGESPCIELHAQLQGDDFVRFEVRDSGAGLTAAQQARLFTLFERLGQSRVKGHGLGLSIVRRITEKLGGQVGVESRPGEGSTFYFTLPAAKPVSRLISE